MKLNLLVLKTPKLEAMKEFYSALGAQFESEKHGKGPKHYAARIGDNLILELYPACDGAMPVSELRLGLNVEDLGETLLTLGQTAETSETQWGLRALVHDPDGRTIELVQTNAICAHA
ncbi:hypothetical protein KF913_21130 [Candidatus Obscuribacterales bacterium]|nr:hypothetical protein [Candidatus Obscuribacterales bacterium]